MVEFVDKVKRSDDGVTEYYFTTDEVDALYDDYAYSDNLEDEGNGYHTLFFSLSWDDDMIKQALELEHDDHTPDEVVILG